MTRAKRPIGSAALSLAVLAVMASAGCSSTPARSAPEKATVPSVSPMAAPSVTEVPSIQNTRDQALPVEKYLISPAERTEIDRGWSRKVASCMKRFGFDYEPIVREASGRTSQTAHRYDPTDAQTASSRGYHGGNGGGDAKAPTADPLSQDMRTVLGAGLGAPRNSGIPEQPEFHGIPIPAGGCAGEAQQAIMAGGGAMQDAQIAVDINFNNYVRSMDDGRVKEAFRKWSDCMKAGGFNYPTPVAAVNDPRWVSPAPSSDEIATASADVKCKQEHNVIGVWFTVESAYESEDIQARLKELTQARGNIDLALRNAAADSSG